MRIFEKNERLKLITTNFGSFLLSSLSFLLILYIGYGLTFEVVFSFFIFLLSLLIPFLIIKNLAKGEIEYVYVPFVIKKIDVKKEYPTNYLKEFPCWLVCNLILSAFTLFKIPIFLPGRFVFIGWRHPFKHYNADEKNSENLIISEHFSFVIFSNIIFSLFLFLFLPNFLSLIPVMINFYLLLPIPGNFGLDFYSINFKKWKNMFLVNLLVLLSLLLAVSILSFSS